MMTAIVNKIKYKAKNLKARMNRKIVKTVENDDDYGAIPSHLALNVTIHNIEHFILILRAINRLMLQPAANYHAEKYIQHTFQLCVKFHLASEHKKKKANEEKNETKRNKTHHDVFILIISMFENIQNIPTHGRKTILFLCFFFSFVQTVSPLSTS